MINDDINGKGESKIDEGIGRKWKKTEVVLYQRVHFTYSIDLDSRKTEERFFLEDQFNRFPLVGAAAVQTC